MDNNIIVFSDSYEAEGFVTGVDFINKYLEKHNLKIKLQFIEDFVSDEGDNAYCVSICSMIYQRKEIIDE